MPLPTTMSNTVFGFELLRGDSAPGAIRACSNTRIYFHGVCERAFPSVKEPTQWDSNTGICHFFLPRCGFVNVCKRVYKTCKVRSNMGDAMMSCGLSSPQQLHPWTRRQHRVPPSALR